MSQQLKPIRRSLFLISLPMVFILFGLPLRAEDLGASAFQIGILFSIFTASMLVLRPLVGFGIDHLGRRAFFIAGMVFYLFANSLYAIGDSIIGLYIARTFHGIGFSILAITAETITADLTERDERAAAMGENIAARSRGGMLGAFVGFTLVGLMPIHAWTYSFAMYAFVSVLAIWFAVRTIPETLQRKHTDQAPAKFHFPPKYYPLLLVIFLAAFAGAIIQPYYLIYLRGRIGLEVYALAGVFLPIGIAYAVLPGMLGKLTNKLNRALTVSIGLLMAAGIYASVPHINSFWLLIAAFTGAAIGNVLIDLTKAAWIADIAAQDAAGRTFGLAALVAGLGAALGPLVGGIIYDDFGKEYIFYANAAVLVVAVLFALRFIKDGKARLAAQQD